MVFKTSEGRMADNIQKIQIDIAKIEEHLKNINGKVTRTDADLCKLSDKHVYDVKCIEDKIDKFSGDIVNNKVEIAKIAGVSGLAGLGGGGGMMLVLKAIGV